MAESKQQSVLIINGPNLDLLGKREPGIYGSETLKSICDHLKDVGDSLGIRTEFFQSNSEGALVDRIHEAMGNAGFIIINAGAYTHTSVAIRDALLGVSVPFFEVHISNVHAREEFRHHSYLSDKAAGVICGFGSFGYAVTLLHFVGVATSAPSGAPPCCSLTERNKFLHGAQERPKF